MEHRQTSIPEPVYERLQEERREHESVGDAIDRLLGGPPLAEFWGVWNVETAASAREAIATSREQSRRR